MLNIWELLKGLKYRINGGEWEVQTGTGEVIHGAMTKAPLGGEKDGAKPYRPRQRRRQTESAD